MSKSAGIEASVHDVVSSKQPPLLMLTRLKRALHTYFAADPIPHVEVAQLMLWMYTLGQSDYDQELKQELFAGDDPVTESERECITTKIYSVTQRFPQFRTNWNDELIQHYLDLTTGDNRSTSWNRDEPSRDVPVGLGPIRETSTKPTPGPTGAGSC